MSDQATPADYDALAATILACAPNDQIVVTAKEVRAMLAEIERLREALVAISGYEDDADPEIRDIAAIALTALEA